MSMLIYAKTLSGLLSNWKYKKGNQYNVLSYTYIAGWIGSYNFKISNLTLKLFAEYLYHQTLHED